MLMTPSGMVLSLVVVCRNEDRTILQDLCLVREQACKAARDVELIVVDNGSTDATLAVLKTLVSSVGWPNVQVLALALQVDTEVAMWAGIEHALGDAVLTLNHQHDDLQMIAELVKELDTGADVVLCTSSKKRRPGFLSRVAYEGFRAAYKRLSGLDINRDLASFRVVTRSVITHLMRQPSAVDSYRHLALCSGFVVRTVASPAKVSEEKETTLLNDIDKALGLLISTSDAPMRTASTLLLFGALANLLYSLYVVAIAIFKNHVAEGWVSTSLQASGMFFLISTALFFMGEYIVKNGRAGRVSAGYVIAQQLCSESKHFQRINVEGAVGGTVSSISAAKRKLA